MPERGTAPRQVLRSRRATRAVKGLGAHRAGEGGSAPTMSRLAGGGARLNNMVGRRLSVGRRGGPHFVVAACRGQRLARFTCGPLRRARLAARLGYCTNCPQLLCDAFIAMDEWPTTGGGGECPLCRRPCCVARSYSRCRSCPCAQGGITINGGLCTLLCHKFGNAPGWLQ